MKQIPSAEFRRSYASLTEPVEVTALGRVIGRYLPAGISLLGLSEVIPAMVEDTKPGERPFTDFRPAPKPGKRK